MPDAGALSPAGEPVPSFRLKGNLAPLGYRNFALYWIGLATTRFGKAVEDLGAVWIVYVLTDSPALLGLLGLARAIPAIVVGPFAGVVADRFDQRRMLFVTQGLGLIASLTLGLLIASGRVELWHVYLQVAVQSAIDSFDGAARQALFPRLVARVDLSEAVTLSAAAGRVSTLIGPVVGGIAIATLGVASPFLINALTFVGLMVALLAMTDIPVIRRPGPAVVQARPVRGLRPHPVGSDPERAAQARIRVRCAPDQRRHHHDRRDAGAGPRPEGVGLLQAAPALGALIGLLILLFTGQAIRQGRLVIYCMLAYSVGSGGVRPLSRRGPLVRRDRGHGLPGLDLDDHQAQRDAARITCASPRPRNGETWARSRAERRRCRSSRAACSPGYSARRWRWGRPRRSSRSRRRSPAGRTGNSGGSHARRPR
jgi:MFS family permease